MLHPVYELAVRSKERRKEWVKLIKEYKKSELTRLGFIKERGLKVEDFKRWCYRLNKEEVKTNRANFIPLRVDAEIPAEVELYHSSGFRLRVGLDSDEGVLKKVITLLSGLS